MQELTRRRFLTRTLTQLASGVIMASLSAEAFADALHQTPWVEEGPFYPYNALPLDRDNDLIIVGKSLTPAIGVVAHLAGKVTDSKGTPVKNALIEIWEVDNHGIYLAQGPAGRDANFQGYGRFETDSQGRYRFRTLKPVPYPGRSAPHIHVKITAKGKSPFTTQIFTAGHPGNASDMLYRQLTAEQRPLVTKTFAPISGSKAGEMAVAFDIVLGATPQEDERGQFGGRGRFGPPRF